MLNKLNATTWKQEVKTDLKDELSCVIGDDKSLDFKPQMKIERFSNECNVSIRLIEDDTETPTIETEGDKIKYIKKDKECHFYNRTVRRNTLEEELSKTYERKGECQRCGACCEICQKHIIERDGEGCYLGNGECKNYEKRPDRCREYPTLTDLYSHKMPNCGFYLEKRKEKKENITPTGEDEDTSEFEIVLKKKPKTNIIKFSIVDKDVAYYYQPKLTQKEIDEGAVRPPEVVGSYAIYAKTPKTNWTGGKEYKCGKIGHIFRPKIIDSAGNWIWGILNINKEAGILSVEIPQDFLDNAVYPIKHAAGLEFGYSTAGATTVGFGDQIRGSVFTTPAGSSIGMDDIRAYMNMGGTSDYYRYAIYLHSDSTQVANSLTADTQASAATQWWPLTYSTKPTLLASTAYVLVAGCDNPKSTHYIYYDAGNVSQGHYQGITYPTFPATATFTHDNNKYSIYATYQTSGASVNSNFFAFM